ncbi:MAG: chloride channel protein [Coriobacteriales bacterium]|nr:chloride channel protein [Coriobacteriales bacterium]
MSATVFARIKSTVMYLLVAAVCGVLVGAICAVFGRVLLAIGDVRTQHYLLLVPFLPLGGLLIMAMYRRLSPESLQGMKLVFDAALGKRDNIPLPLIPLIMLGTWITHLFGGSAGREGVAVQIGATLSHALATRLKLKNARVLLVAGMAAGFAGLFQTPLAAVFFALEVIVSGALAYEALPCALVSAFVASTTSHALGLEKFSVAIDKSLELNMHTALPLILAGLAFGLTGLLFSKGLAWGKTRANDLFPSPYKRIFFGSIPLAAILLLAFGGRYCGLGTNLISCSFSGGTIYPFDWLAKLALTICTLSLGFQGGEVTPLFAMGASLGFVLGSAFGLPPEIFAAMGYAAVFGSATNTLLAPIFIGLEVFGGANIAPLALVCIVAWLPNANSSIYGGQTMAKPWFLREQDERQNG